MGDVLRVPSIVVGVDGSSTGVSALEWAADTAALWRCPLHLVHAARADEFDIDAQSQRILAWADRRLARTGRRHLEVTMSVRRGVPVAVLSQAGATAQLLVLGRRGSGSLRCPELMLGATALACATRSPTPVVVVPTKWPVRVGQAQVRGRCLVIGVDGSPAGQAAIEFAFTEAAERNLSLTAVYAGSPKEGAPLLDDALATWREKYPDIAVTERVERSRPAATLIRTAARAALLVVGARGDGSPLGSVTQAVLRHAACPVAVVPSLKERTP